MIYQAYSVKDLKAEAFAPPFFLINNQVAMRGFNAALRDPQNQMSQWPADYALYRIGEFADDTGGLSPLPEPELVVSGETLNGQG